MGNRLRSYKRWVLIESTALCAYFIVSPASLCSRSWRSRYNLSYSFLRFLMGNGLEIGFPASSQRTYVAACKPNIDGNEPGVTRELARFSDRGVLHDILLTKYWEYPDAEIL